MGVEDPPGVQKGLEGLHHGDTLRTLRQVATGPRPKLGGGGHGGCLVKCGGCLICQKFTTTAS